MLTWDLAARCTLLVSRAELFAFRAGVVGKGQPHPFHRMHRGITILWIRGWTKIISHQIETMVEAIPFVGITLGNQVIKQTVLNGNREAGFATTHRSTAQNLPFSVRAAAFPA